MLYQTNAMLVGGEPTYAEQFRIKALKHGIKLNIVHHINWDQTRKSFPTSDLQVVIVLKDICNHKLRDWASAEAKKNNVKFCEISQKISIGIARLRQTLGIENIPVELLEDDASLNFQGQPQLQVMHGILEDNIELFVPKNKTVLASKKKYLTNFARQFCDHVLSESEGCDTPSDIIFRTQPKRVKGITLDTYIMLRDIYVSALKKKSSGVVEVEEIARRVIIDMAVKEDWSLFDIKRTLSYALGYTLTKKQEGDIKLMRKHKKEELIGSDVKTIVDLILGNPVEIMGIHDNDETRRSHVANFLGIEITEQDFSEVMGLIYKVSRDRKGHSLKRDLIRARESWSRHYLDLRKSGQVEISKSEFVSCHKSTWGSRISDTLRKEYFPPVVEEKTQVEEKSPVVEEKTQEKKNAWSSEVQESIARRNASRKEVQVENTPVLEEVQVENTPVLEEVAQSIATVLIGNLELELTGSLSIKEVSVGTQIKVLSGEKKITIESFDGNSLKGVTIC